MTPPMDYLDLVIATVQGRSPVPEFANYKVDRSALAKQHVNRLKEKFKNETTGNLLINMVLTMGEGFLLKSWDRLAPAALTMCGKKSLDQLLKALDTIAKEDILGDFIEAGVWRGGLPIIMRAFLQSHGDRNRKVLLADSFRGLPETFEESNDRAAHLLLEPLMHLSASRKQVEESLEFFGLLDDQVQFVEGWFSDTLTKIESESFALIRLDGDYYESTRDSLLALYCKLSPGGYLIVDDYGLPLGCRRAVDEYREKNGITEPMTWINNQAIFWRKAT